MKFARLPLAGLLLALFWPKSLASAAENTLVISLRRWEGEYESNGKSTPSTASIYTIKADGTEAKEIVAIDQTVCAAPAFSPDGRWLYFQANASGQYHLYRCRADGSAREQLTSATRPGRPWTSVFGLQVAANGSLLCTANDGSSGCVAVLTPDGSQLNLVAPHLGYLYMSAMSPQGDAVIVSGPASDYRLWLLKLPDAYRSGPSRLSGPTVILAADQPHSYAPQFTPDGRTIVYVRRDGDIYRVESDGTGAKRLTEGNLYVEFRLSPKDLHGSTDGPHLSPDGKRIAYIAVREGVPNIWVINIDGSDPRQLTFRKTPCGRVRWSPDGRSLAFVSFEGKYPQLFIVPAEGGELRKLTDLDGAVYTINWKPRADALRP